MTTPAPGELTREQQIEAAAFGLETQAKIIRLKCGDEAAWIIANAAQLLRECAPIFRPTCVDGPVEPKIISILRDNAIQNQWVELSTSNSRAILNYVTALQSLQVSAESAGLLVEAGKMPAPIRNLHSAIHWKQEEIDKGESVWGLGDIDRGFQNMGMEINYLRASLRAALQSAAPAGWVRDRDELLAALHVTTDALQNMGDYWAYGMAKTEGAQPTPEDDTAVTTISTAARKAVDDSSAILAKHDAGAVGGSK